MRRPLGHGRRIYLVQHKETSVSSRVLIPAEFEVDARADDLVVERYASPSINGARIWREIRCVVQIDMEIFKLCRPVLGEPIFNTGARRPTCPNMGFGERFAVFLVGDGFDIG